MIRVIHKEEKEILLHRRFIKSYKKNTLAVFFSFTLTFLLLTTMLVLLHTNHRIANIQAKTEFTPSDCYIKGLSKQQVDLLSEDGSIAHLAVEQEKRYTYQRNNQTVFLSKGNSKTAVMMAKVIDGRMPRREGEVVAEKWGLLNLGIEPVIDKEVTVKNKETEEEQTFRLVGILSDIYGNKKYGVINLHTVLDEQTDGSYIAYLRLKNGVSYEEKMNSLRSGLDIQDKQIKECPARENFRELYKTDAEVIGVLLIICMVVFYGIYRIAALTRKKQYGILRALGMKRKQLQKMILLELFQIYAVSVPVGIGIGLFLSYGIIIISGDRDREVYLYNETVRFSPVIPVWQILICIVVTAFFIGCVGYSIGKQVSRSPVVETLSDMPPGRKEKRSVFGLGASGSKTGTLFHMGCKYICRDLKTSCFVVLTICLGVTLFTGLAYRTQLLGTYREDTKEIYYLNGQYAMTMLGFDQVGQGISRDSLEAVKKLPDVTEVKTSAGFPVRVIDKENIRRNEAYYEEYNDRLREYHGYEDEGYDGKNQVYKSMVCGYNENALRAMKKYVISGDYQPENLGEDEIILSVLRMDDTKENEIPGPYKEGTPLMEYKAGDEIQIKYRADLNTGTVAYEKFEDCEGEYRYKTYHIAAVVSFAYMYDCNRTVYPLLITSDSQIQKMAPDSGIQCMYVDGREGMSLSDQMALEQQLIRICNQNNDVSTRSLISEIEQNEMFYHKQMVYVYGIAAVAFVLVLINMMNNLRYRMQTRTREICMLRAVGMSVSMTKKMLMFENTVLGLAAVGAGFLLLQPVLKYLYRISDMKAFGHPFRFDFVSFAAVSAGALLLCILLSFGILKAWKTKRIVEGIGKVE